MMQSAPTWKTYRALLKRCRAFLKTQRPFLQHGKCVKTKPGYPIVSCRGRVRLPEDTKQTVFGRANLAPTHETTALSTFWPPVCKVCTYASVYTYGGISPHVRTHRPTRTYAWACTYICHCVRLRHILCRDWISLSSLLTKAFLCCIFVVRQI